MKSDDRGQISRVRDYWDARPCNVKHSQAEVGTRRYFDEVEQRKYYVEPHIPEFAQFERWAGKKVLEIGCGIGTDAVNFARAGAYYSAIELSKESLDLAKRRFQVYGLEGTFQKGNAEDLASVVPIETYDLIYSFGVIHHTPDPLKVVDSARSYMDGNSEFRLMLYAKNSWKDIMIEAGLDQPEAQSGCPIAYTYTQEEVRELLKDYEITELRQAHIFPYKVDKYVRYEYELEPWFEAMPKAMFEALSQRLGWHTLITCRLPRAG